MTRVLLSAYQCGPGMGSVSQIGWEWYSRLSARTPVTLLTHVRNRPALEAAGAPLLGSEVHFIDTEWFAGPLYLLAKRLFPNSEHSVFLISSLDFFVYDYAACRKAAELQRAGARWDVVHAVTPVSPVASTRLHRLGIPTVLGPWNGGLTSPKTFPELSQQDSAWVYRIRDLGRLGDWVRGCTRNAMSIMVANQTTLDSLPVGARGKCVTVLENGVDLDLFRPTPWPAAPGAENPLRVLYVGRLIPFKALNFLLEAARRLQGRIPLEITIVGDGPMRGPWEEMAGTMGVAPMVRFTGALPLPEVARLHAASHVFCLPCIRESGGAVLLEAMACARPIIAVGYGGPAVVTNDDVGRALSIDGPEPLISGLVSALQDIVNHPEQWCQRGIAGRHRAESEYGWDAKVDAVFRLYRSSPESVVPRPESVSQ